jgi:lysophospholipase L1-like esterase
MTMPACPMLASIFTSGAFGYLFDYIVWCGVFASLLVHAVCFFKFFPRARYPKLGLVVGNVLVFSVMIGSVALVAESYLRFVAVYTDSFGVSLPARRWFVLYTTLNSMGCRDHEWKVEKPDGVRRIAFVGDSYTYGWGIKRVEDRFPDRIQAMFDQRAPGTVEVMNVAKPGWGTGDEIRPLEDMITVYDADEIVLCYVPNDLERLIPTTDDFNPTRPPDSQFINLDSSPLIDYLYRRIYLPFVPTVRGYDDWLANGFADERVWREHAAQLTDMASFCREHNVTLRVVLLPFLMTTGNKFDAHRIHKKVASVFESLNVPVADMLPVIENAGVEPSTLVVNSLDAHPNEKAHAMFAKAIAAAFYAP